MEDWELADSQASLSQVKSKTAEIINLLAR